MSNSEDETEILRNKIRSFQEKLSFIESHCDAVGLLAEYDIWKALGGKMFNTNPMCGYDILSECRTKYEVKYSSGRISGGAWRWTWDKVKGIRNANIFDRLILIGKINPEYTFKLKYKDEKSKVVVFSVPYIDIEKYTIDMPKRYWPAKRIDLTANPTQHHRMKNFYTLYEIKIDDIKEKTPGNL